MPIQNIPIPSYLEPPSQGEQAQLALERDRMQQAQADKIAKSIQSRVAMEKLIGDARVNQAGGMDPQEAQQAALFANAPALFPDDPNKVTQLQDTILQRQKFAQAKRQYQSAFDADVKAGVPPETAFANNWSKWAPDLIPQSSLGSSMSSIYRTDTQAKTAEMKTGVDMEKFKERQDQAKKLAEMKIGSTEGMFNTKMDMQGKQFEENLALKKDKAGVGKDAPEPEVKTLADGTSYIHVPGSKTIHIIKKNETILAFMTKTIPKLTQSGLTEAQAEAEAQKIWDFAQNAASKDQAKNAPPPEPGSKVVRKYNPSTGQLE